MKLIKLTAISAAVLASTAALAAEPVIVVDNNDAVVYEAEPVAVAYQAEPVAVAYQAEPVAVVQPANSYSDRTFFQTVTHPAAISAEVGTLGYGANIGWALNDKTELQAGWAGGDVADLFGGDFDANDVNYDVDSDFSNPYLGVQLRPTGNWFTMGAGIIVPDNDIEVTSNPNGGVYKVDGKQYNANDVGTLKGTLDHRNKLAPYATIGFRPNITNNFGLFGEIGAAYMGKTSAEVSSVGGASGFIRDENGVVTGETSASVAQKAEKELEDKDWLEWMPIVKVGATYRF